MNGIRIASLAVVLSAACGSLLSARAQVPQTPAALTPCIFTPAEIAAALGVSVEKGEAADMKISEGRDVGCSYAVVGSSMVVSVRQTWDAATPSVAPSVAADPDGAKVSPVPMGGPALELSYARGKVRTRVIVHGGTFNDADMQARLLRLRRVP